MLVDPLAQMLSSSHIFEQESLFVEYQTEYTIPTIASLMLSVGRDVVWKSLNHKILLQTRSKGKCVRLVAVHCLHKLFTEVTFSDLSVFSSIISNMVIVIVIDYCRLGRIIWRCYRNVCHFSQN